MNPVLKALSQFTEEHLEYSYLARLGYFPLEKAFDRHWEQFLQTLEEEQREQLTALYEELLEIRTLERDAVFLATWEMTRALR